jgi:hypothetical protein
MRRYRPVRSARLAGSSEKDDQVLKFTAQGKFLAQFGRQGKSGGSADTQNLGAPPTSRSIQQTTSSMSRTAIATAASS